MKASLIVLVSLTGFISGVLQKTDGTYQFNRRCSFFHGNHHLLVDCSNRHLNRIPKCPPTVDILNLHNNSLKNIPDKAFENLHELLELDISSNKLSNISIDAFVGLHNLKRLILEDNRLDFYSYPLGVFKSLVSLVYLNIKFNGNNQFSIIPDYAILDLVKLESLEVDAYYPSGVFIFGRGLSRLPSLKRIKTGICEMSTVNNETFFNMPHLEFIDLSLCSILRYDAETLSNRRKLIYLDMSNVYFLFEYFKKFFEDIQLLKVKILKITGIVRELTELPLCFFRNLIYTGIEVLYINNNTFVVADNNIFKMCNAVPTTLKLLDFSNNLLIKFCFEIPYLLTLNLRNNTLGQYLGQNSYMDNETGISQLEMIDLSYNKIMSLSFTIFHYQPNLKIINLSHNFLSNITFDLSHNINLQLLDLSSNRIKLFEKETMDLVSSIAKNLKLTIDMTGNTLQCNCRALPFLRWMNDNKYIFLNIQSYKCVSENEAIIQLNNFPKIVQEIEKECKSYTDLITCVSVAITACGIAIATGLIYRYRWKIRYLYYLSKGKYYSYKPVDDSIHTYKYDAFISFSEIDFGFIKNCCIPQLEINSNLKLCIHNRDFMPGEEITVNITNAIHNSRKTICVISRAFLNSYYCRFEFNMARMESIYSRSGHNILLLVFYEQILPKELPLVLLELVQEQSYIEYPHDEQGNVVFWEKLKEAIA
ncbi:unnamed protein product [Mytilus coruscus]|uniref:TIR domain-containing protein n=1 Tax=Mytilus coruscus TaxID=42192 RepID=A0A6J8AWV7_MYTCO|nr:unnamed protein product [Mytilus coruscus]